MSGSPSIEYYIDIFGETPYAYAINPKFPDQRVDICEEMVQDLKAIVYTKDGLNSEDAAHEILLAKYKEKYLK